jgi:hypothetical protein
MNKSKLLTRDAAMPACEGKETPGPLLGRKSKKGHHAMFLLLCPNRRFLRPFLKSELHAFPAAIQNKLEFISQSLHALLETAERLPP